jgi:hypothetical protein
MSVIFTSLGFGAPAICLSLKVIIGILFTLRQSAQEELWSVHI